MLEHASDISSIEYVPELESVCITTQAGDIVVVDIADKTGECVGALDSGIVAARWSPDYELVALATASDTLVIMTKDWDTVSDEPIHPVAQGDDTASERAAASVSLTWRGDGEFLACSSIDPARKERTLHVFARDGSLHSTGDQCTALAQPICWRFVMRPTHIPTL
jgi:elongator complex protein 1